MSMDDNQLLRYSRQIMLPDIDAAGQQRLLDSTTLIIGLGGLGSPAALYLAAAGVGHLLLVDHDQVDLSNLQRQILHGTPDINRAKTDSARDRLAAINPDVRITAINHKLAGDELAAQVQQADVVLDCTDNFASRFAINAACVAAGRPLVSGAVIRMEGQVSVFGYDKEAPCYRCLYQEDDPEQEQRCADNGVLAPVAGVIGSLQATEAIKVLLGKPGILNGRLLLLDAATMQFREIGVRKDPACPVCGHQA
jgi:adenylyltransferase/sulfurtransferase